MGWGITDGLPADMLIWVFAVFLSIIVHEMGHAVFIRAYGGRPWIVLYGMGGLACGGRRGGPGEQIQISAAGPGAGFMLAAIILLVTSLVGYRVSLPVGDGHYAFNLPFW